MARYEVIARKAYLVPIGEGQDGGPRMFERGAKVELSNDVLPGAGLKPLDAAARAAKERKAKLDEERKAQIEKEKAAKLAATLHAATAA
jgi:hypothetical protein